MSRLTASQFLDLEAVREGADVYDRISAGRYRHLEARGLVSCVAPRHAGGPLIGQPSAYFGAVLTSSGRRLLDEHAARLRRATTPKETTP